MTPDLLFPLAASTDAVGALTDLFVVLLAAKLGDELFKRIHQPTVVGEILAGVVIGPSVLGLVDLGEVLGVFSELGVIFLLFWVGLETRLSDLRSVGRTALLVAVLGVVFPGIAGFALGELRGEDTATSAFFAAALVATSVGITSAVLAELGAVRTRPGRTILAAAVVDDILAILVLSVAVGIAADGSVDAAGIALTAGLSFAFVAFVALGGGSLLRGRPGLLTVPRFADSPLLPAVLLCLGLAVVAGEVGLAGIIGAFLAGMVISESPDRDAVENEVGPLYAFFPPFFFAAIGIQLDLGALADGATLLLLAGVTTLAVVTKLAGGWLGARGLGARDALVVGVGMIPRGEVGIIVASIGAAEGVINDRLFAVIVGMAIVTTLIVPPALRVMLARRDDMDGLVPEGGPG
ncbi:MAG TPA: cation:proton antiporter [Solirubrobacteraceae bacterium]|nr:cation:proton antiporter [Solirubrobacteraceae bacterium]